jgi:hypothetical protein
MTSEQKAAFNRDLSTKYQSRLDRDYDSNVNLVLAKLTIEDERSAEDVIPVFLSDRVRDKLVFNGRMDAAHALLNTIVILRKVNLANRLLVVLIILVVILICGVYHISLWGPRS